MAKQDEISSTEKLLNLIRKDQADPAESLAITDAEVSSDSLLTSFKKVIPFRKKITVGVDIGYGFLKLVKISETATGNYELVDCVDIPLQEGVSVKSPEFALILKEGLSRFCGNSEDIDLWSAIPSENVETRYLKIPILPKKQRQNAAFWSFKKEVNFNEKEYIFDFEIIGEFVDGNARQTEIIAYNAPKNEVKNLQDLFFRAGFPLTGISIVPFALQNLLRTNWIRTEGEDVCTLFIGRDWSRIAIFSKNNLIISRDIKAGMKSMIEAMIDQVEDTGTETAEVESEEINMLEASEGQQFDKHMAWNTFFSFIDGMLEQEEGPRDSIGNREHIFEMILPALDRVIRQVERTLEHYSMNFSGGLIKNIFISGKLSTNQQITGYIEKQIGLPIQQIDPFAFVTPVEEHTSCPESSSERGAYVPAVGIALSSNQITPNFMFTSKEKDQIVFINRARKAVFGFIILLVACFAGIYLWQNYKIGRETNRLAGLKTTLDNLAPRVDKTLIAKMVSMIQEKKRIKKETGNRYLGAAVVSEISRITPDHIKLFNITLEPRRVLKDYAAGQKPAGKKETIEGEKEIEKKIIILDGIVYGDRLSFESSVIGYVLKLKKSPLFGNPMVKKKSFQTIENQEVLKFSAEMELI